MSRSIVDTGYGLERMVWASQGTPTVYEAVLPKTIKYLTEKANLSDEFETLLIGGGPEKTEADSLHILEEYGVKARLLNEMRRKPSFFSDKDPSPISKDFIPLIDKTAFPSLAFSFSCHVV